MVWGVLRALPLLQSGAGLTKVSSGQRGALRLRPMVVNDETEASGRVLSGEPARECDEGDGATPNQFWIRSE